MRTLAVLAAIMVAGCAHGDAAISLPARGEVIIYSVGQCFGRCPQFTVQLRPDGQGIFTGKRFTAVIGTHRFRFPPELYAATGAQLTRYVPRDGRASLTPGDPGCERGGTDLPMATIAQRHSDGKLGQLLYTFGCWDDPNPVDDALAAVPRSIPAVAAMIGDRP